MENSPLRDDILEIKHSQVHLSNTVSDLNITVAQMGVAVTQLAQTQQAQADHDRRLVVLEQGHIADELRMKRDEDDIAKERTERKEQARFHLTLLVSLLAVVLGAVLTVLLPKIWH